MSRELVHARAVADPGAALADALDRTLTGEAVFEPGETVLLDDAGRGVLALEDGVPVRAYHTATGREGADAVADLSGAGPYRVEFYAAADPRTRGGPVAPDVPAEVLADDPGLAERTRRAAPADAPEAGESADALAAFLDDEEKVAAIKQRAREEAQRRAEEWGFTEQTRE
jgi:hypothetical protein